MNEVCKQCDGTGLYQEKVCDVCGGTGSMPVEPEMVEETVDVPEEEVEDEKKNEDEEL